MDLITMHQTKNRNRQAKKNKLWANYTIEQVAYGQSKRLTTYKYTRFLRMHIRALKKNRTKFKSTQNDVPPKKQKD